MPSDVTNASLSGQGHLPPGLGELPPAPIMGSIRVVVSGQGHQAHQERRRLEENQQK